MTDPSRWDDLRARLVSASVLAALGLGAIWAGGSWFAALAAAAAGIMTWELTRMAGPASWAVPLGLLAAVAILAGRWLGWPWAVLALAVPVAAGGFGPMRDRAAQVIYSAVILFGVLGLVVFRDGQGARFLFWIVGVVVASDVAGYFAGRMLGGPKFWPRVSPKKTWSGTVAGWVGAALVGLAFATATAAWALVWLSPVVAFAAQMGDIAESAVKRRAGVKDASALIPGHGGLMDRFDALLGATVALLAVDLFADLPGF